MLLWHCCWCGLDLTCKAQDAVKFYDRWDARYCLTQQPAGGDTMLSIESKQLGGLGLWFCDVWKHDVVDCRVQVRPRVASREMMSCGHRVKSSEIADSFALSTFSPKSPFCQRSPGQLFAACRENCSQSMHCLVPMKLADTSLNKKLSYRRKTARRAMLVNSCYYVSRGIKARNVSNSKSDLQGHLRALTMVPFDRPHTIFY